MGDIPELKSRDTEPYDISLSECEATYHVAKKTLKKYVEKYISEDNAGAFLSYHSFLLGCLVTI